jgi:hypothetical protein
MKYKYVKIAQIKEIATVAAPLIGAAVEGSAEAAALSQIKNILSGESGKDMLEEGISHFKDKAKQEQFQGAEDFSTYMAEIESLKNAYMSSGFSAKEFDSYFAEVYKLENPRGLLLNPKVSKIDIHKRIELMKQAKDDAVASSLPLRKVFNAYLMLYSKTMNLALAKDVVKRAVKLENEVSGVGILDSLFNAMSGNVSETSLMMALLGTPELMREYTEIIAQATGHKLAPVELYRRDAEIAKNILDNQIIENGLTRGLQNAIESINIRQQAAASLKALNNIYRNTTSFSGFFRNIYYYLWMGDNLAVEGSASVIPSNAGLKPNMLSGGKFSSNNNRVITAATTVVLNPTQAESELKQKFADSLTKTQSVFRGNYQAEAAKLIDTVRRLYVARRTNNVAAFNALRPSVTVILNQRGFKNTHNSEFIELAESYLTLLDANQPITETSVETADSMAAPETIEQLAPNKEQGEKFKIALQRYDESKKTYNNIKSSIYGEPGSSMIAGNAKELGQTKLVPYKSPEQVKAKISSAQDSIKSAKAYNKIVQSVLNAWTTTPAASFSGRSPEQVEAIKTRLKSVVHIYELELEKFAADAFELKSEALTVEQTMKQRNERYMGGGQLAAELSGLAASSKGTAYGLAGGVAELNRLMDSQIATQEEKIQKLQGALSSAGSPEERMALEGQLKNADIEKELLKNRLFQQTNDALQGKFDPSFYTDAMSSPGISRSSNSKNKYVLASKFVKESDTEIEDYYNDLYEDSKDSPEYGTALEHPKETRYILTVDIPKHKHTKSSKYKLN